MNSIEKRGAHVHAIGPLRDRSLICMRPRLWKQFLAGSQSGVRDDTCHLVSFTRREFTVLSDGRRTAARCRVHFIFKQRAIRVEIDVVVVEVEWIDCKREYGFQTDEPISR